MSTPRRLAGLLALVLALTLPAVGPAQAEAPIVTDISTGTVVDTCTDVTGPHPCLYQALSIESSGPSLMHTCLYGDYDEPEDPFDGEYQKVCTDLPMNRFVIRARGNGREA